MMWKPQVRRVSQMVWEIRLVDDSAHQRIITYSTKIVGEREAIAEAKRYAAVMNDPKSEWHDA